MRWKPGLLFAVGIASAFICLLLLASSAEFRFQHPAAMGRDLDPAARVQQGTPQAVLIEPVHHFGTLNPHTTARHTFVVRNEGDAPLKLSRGGTSCKCTLAELVDPVIPPGSEGRVELEWNTGSDESWYSQTATLYTNDPQQPSIELRVEGTVRIRLAADPPQIVVPQVLPDEPATSAVLFYTQAFASMQITEVESSLDSLEWQVLPASPEQLAGHQASSGQVLEITLPGEMPPGLFNHWLRVRLETAHGELIEEHQLALSGRVVGRVGIYGEGMQANGSLDLGVIPTGASFQRRLLVKVRDPERELRVRRVSADPAELQVRLEPATSSDQAMGLYYLCLELPPGCAPQSRLAGNPGCLLLEFEHPRIRDLKLPLHLEIGP